MCKGTWQFLATTLHVIRRERLRGTSHQPPSCRHCCAPHRATASEKDHYELRYAICSVQPSDVWHTGQCSSVHTPAEFMYRQHQTLNGHRQTPCPLHWGQLSTSKLPIQKQKTKHLHNKLRGIQHFVFILVLLILMMLFCF